MGMVILLLGDNVGWLLLSKLRQVEEVLAEENSLGIAVDLLEMAEGIEYQVIS